MCIWYKKKWCVSHLEENNLKRMHHGGNKYRTTRAKQQRLLRVRERKAVSCHRMPLGRDTRQGKVEKEEAPSVLWLEVVAWASCRQVTWKGVTCVISRGMYVVFRDYPWFRSENRAPEAVSNTFTPGSMERVVSGISECLLGWLIEFWFSTSLQTAL